MTRMHMIFATSLLCGTMTGCNDSGEPPPTGPGDDPPIDSTARREVVQEVYDLIGTYSGGTAAPIRFELGDFTSGPVDQIRDLPIAQLASVPQDRHVSVQRTTFQSAGLGPSAAYAASWDGGPRWHDKREAELAQLSSMSLRQFLAEQQSDSQAAGVYVSYRATVYLDGKQLSYSALWIQLDAGADTRDLYTIDNVIGSDVVASAVRDRAARRTSMFALYRTVDPVKAEELAAATPYKHAPCPDPFVGAANAGNEKKYKGHKWWGDVGYHWFEWNLKGTCTYADVGWGCSASCSGTATSSSGETSADDTPLYCHYINDSAAYGSGTADPNSSVTCQGAAMAVVKKCLCILGCSVQVRILPSGVGVVIEADAGFDQFGPKNDSINCSGIPHS